MRAALAIAGLEIRRYLQERISLFTTLIMPVALVLIIGAAFGSETTELGVGVLDEDGTGVSAAFVDDLGTTLAVAEYSDAGDLTRDIRLGFLVAGVRVPAGFAAALSSGEPAEVVMTLDQASTDGTAVAAAITATTSTFGQVTTAVEVGLTALGRADEEARGALTEGAAHVATQVEPVTVVGITVGTVPPTGSAFASAVYTQLTLFIFLNGMLAGIPLVESRRLGVSRRMLSTPTGIGPHILGVGLGRWGLGLIQAVLLLGLGIGVFGVSVGDRAAALTLTLLWCALGAAVGMLLGALGRTPEQVVAFSVPLGIGMGMLGGCMWPLSVVPPFMQTIGHITPHAWAVDAWGAIVNDGGGLGDVTLELGVIATAAVAIGALAVVQLRRSLSR